MRHAIKLSLAIMLAAALTIVASAQDKKTAKPAAKKAKAVKFMGKGDGIETCPVTGEPVNKELKGEADGQTFYVCCAGCLDTVKANPAAYLKPAAKK